jgi:glycine betaine/choline ABC-type transport system substrate-binding protein
MVISGSLARSRGLRTLSQAASMPWKLGVGYEFLRRPDGLAALTGTYGLRVEGTPRTMDLGLLYRALEQGQVNLVAGNTTDGLLSVMDVVVLADDRHAFPPYQAALVARANRGLRTALEDLSGRFSEARMRALNYAIDGRHQAVRDVAAEFLKSSGSVQTAREGAFPGRG